jgi:hypothetical protein
MSRYTPGKNRKVHRVTVTKNPQKYCLDNGVLYTLPSRRRPYPVKVSAIGIKRVGTDRLIQEMVDSRRPFVKAGIRWSPTGRNLTI